MFKWLIGNRKYTFIRAKIANFFTNMNGALVFYNEPFRKKVIDLIKQIKKENKIVLRLNEAYQVYMLAKASNKIDGDFAEVGVFKGGSAKLICEAKKNKSLHLFDTFEGLPKLFEMDDKVMFQKGVMKVNIDDVKNYLKDYSDVYFYKGLFLNTADPIKDKKFSFVNIYVDIYESTVSCLNFFYERMNKGGIILSHDYIDVASVKKAIDDFFKDKHETVIELSGSQCMIIKL
ncbi:MAG TPA: TylF/MycF/NovP-related O-methyltransferase [Ignavibacteria bacterium]